MADARDLAVTGAPLVSALAGAGTVASGATAASASLELLCVLALALEEGDTSSALAGS